MALRCCSCRHELTALDTHCPECGRPTGIRPTTSQAAVQNASLGKRLGFGITTVGLVAGSAAFLLGLNHEIALLVVLLGMLVFYLTDLLERMHRPA